MGIYVILLRNERGGAGWMLASGGSGAGAQAAAVEALGGRVLDQYATLGRYDVVLTVEFEEPAAVVAFELAATAAGQYAEVLPAFRPSTVDAARTLAEKAFPMPSREPAPEVQ